MAVPVAISCPPADHDTEPGGTAAVGGTAMAEGLEGAGEVAAAGSLASAKIWSSPTGTGIDRRRSPRERSARGMWTGPIRGRRGAGITG